MNPHAAFDPRRRGFLRSMVGGSLMFPGIVRDLLAREGGLGSTGADPLIPRAPHFTPKAKRVIFLYNGAGSRGCTPKASITSRGPRISRAIRAGVSPRMVN